MVNNTTTTPQCWRSDMHLFYFILYYPLPSYFFKLNCNVRYHQLGNKVIYLFTCLNNVFTNLKTTTRTSHLERNAIVIPKWTINNLSFSSPLFLWNVVLILFFLYVCVIYPVVLQGQVFSTRPYQSVLTCLVNLIW